MSQSVMARLPLRRRIFEANGPSDANYSDQSPTNRPSVQYKASAKKLGSLSPVAKLGALATPEPPSSS